MAKDTFPHHWREGNIPSGARCEICRRTCSSSDVLAGMRCQWCGITVRLKTKIKVSPQKTTVANNARQHVACACFNSVCVILCRHTLPVISLCRQSAVWDGYATCFFTLLVCEYARGTLARCTATASLRATRMSWVSLWSPTSMGRQGSLVVSVGLVTGLVTRSD